MDVGTIAITLQDGTPLVARCDALPEGLTFVPALNADELVPWARRVLESDGVDMREDGLYLSSNDLSAAARFPPLVLPGDLISYATARELLYPDVARNTGFQRVIRDVSAGRLQTYRIGIGQDMRRFLSRAQVQQLLEERRTSATV